MNYTNAESQIFYDLTTVLNFLFKKRVLIKKKCLHEFFAGTYTHEGIERFILRKEQKKESAILHELHENLAFEVIMYVKNDNSSEPVLLGLKDARNSALAGFKWVNRIDFDIEPTWEKAWAVSEDLAKFLSAQGEIILRAKPFADPVWLQNRPLEQIAINV